MRSPASVPKSAYPTFSDQGQEGGAAIISKLSGEPFLSLISPNAVILALSFSAAIGIFFGVYPALRYE